MKKILILLTCGLSMPALADHELNNRDIIQGAANYSAHCAACHGANLEGQANWRTPGADGILPAPPHDASGHTWHHDFQLLFDYTRLGGAKLLEERGIKDFNSGMPGFGALMSEDEIWNVLAYIQSTWPEKVKEANLGVNPRHGQ